MTKIHRGSREPELVLHTPAESFEAFDDGNLPQANSPMQLMQQSMQQAAAQQAKAQDSSKGATHLNQPKVKITEVQTPLKLSADQQAKALEVINKFLKTQGIETTIDSLPEEIQVVHDQELLNDFLIQEVVIQNTAQLDNEDDEDDDM